MVVDPRLADAFESVGPSDASRGGRRTGSPFVTLRSHPQKGRCPIAPLAPHPRETAIADRRVRRNCARGRSKGVRATVMMLSLLVAVLSSSCRGERPEAEPPALAYSVSDGDCLGRCPIGTVVSVFVRDRAGQPISGAAVVLIPIANDGRADSGTARGSRHGRPAARPTRRDDSSAKSRGSPLLCLAHRYAS